MSRPALALLVALLLAAPAHAATTPVRGVSGAGPAKYDKSYVTKFGPSNAGTVMVLVPGYLGGGGSVSLVARDIVEQVDGLQVWVVDRRSQALEDTSVFERGLSGDVSLQQVFDYYVGWISDPSIQPHYVPPAPESITFGKRWGLPTHIGDLRRVVLEAKRGGRHVILGGHSLGASTAAIYAAWDFNGRPGYRDVDALVLIDGGALGTFDDVHTLAQVRSRLREIDEQPWGDAVGLGLPWTQGIFTGVGALYAMKEPTSLSPFWNFELLPQKFRPPFPVTNRALLARAFDRDTTPEDLDLDVRAGHLAESGDPRDWVDGEVSTSARVAEFFGRQDPNAVEWYFPERLRLDVDGANPMRRNAVTRRLRLRPWHLAKVDVPLYAFQTDLTGGRVLRGARRYIARSRVPRRASVLVDRASSTSHDDPVTAPAATNDFLKTVVPFLRAVMRRR